MTVAHIKAPPLDYLTSPAARTVIFFCVGLSQRPQDFVLFLVKQAVFSFFDIKKAFVASPYTTKTDQPNST